MVPCFIGRRGPYAALIFLSNSQHGLTAAPSVSRFRFGESGFWDNSPRPATCLHGHPCRYQLQPGMRLEGQAERRCTPRLDHFASISQWVPRLSGIVGLAARRRPTRDTIGG